MKRFEVYRHPTLGLEAVKNGFSWPGFFFTWIWMLICRMWVGAVIVATIYIASAFVGTAIGEAAFGGGDGPASAMDLENIEMTAGMVSMAVALVLNLVVGAKGNAWRRSALTRRGFTRERSMQAATADAAVAEATAEQKTPEAASA